MAIGVEQLKSNDVNSQAKDTGLVFDMAFLNELQLKSGQTKEGFAQAINDWAEKQVDDDLHQDDGGLSFYLQQYKQSASNEQAVDGYFDDQLQNDYLKAREGLIGILSQFVETQSAFFNEIKGLKEAIKFKLTSTGNNKFMNGVQAETYYNNSGQQKPISVSAGNVNGGIQNNLGNTNTSTVGGGLPALWRDRNNDVGRNVDYTKPSDNAPAHESKQNVNNTVENAMMGYIPQNIYTQKTDGGKDYETDVGKAKQRRILNEWAKGNKEGSLDIVEVTGDAKINKPDANEVSNLKEYFTKPLKRLSINHNGWFTKDLDQKLDTFHIRDMVVRAYDEGNLSGTQPLAGIGGEEKNKKYWLNNMPGSIATQSDKALFVEEMSKLSALYTSVMKDKYAGTHTARLVHMMNNTARAEGAARLSSEGGRTGSIVAIHNMNNNNTGEINLGSHPVLTRDSKKSQALEYLSIVVGKGNEKLANAIIDGKVPVKELKELFNSAMATRKGSDNEGLKFKFEGGSDLYESIVTNSLSNDASSILAEGYAYGASAVEIYNIKNIADNGEIDTARRGEISDSTRFMNFLADYNNTGGVGPSDHSINSGEQLLFNYRIAVARLQNTMNTRDAGQAESQAGKNIIKYIIGLASQKGDHYVSNILQEHQNTSLLDLVKQHPGLVKYMQDSLRTVPAGDDLQDIMASGSVAGEDILKQTATKSSIDAISSLPLSETEKLQMKAAIEKATDMKYAEFQKNLNNLPADQRQYYDYIDRELLKQHIANTVSGALQTNEYGAGIGAAINIVNGVQVNMALATGPDGIPVPGIGIGLDTKLRKGGKAGLNINVLVPNISGYVGQSWEGTKDHLVNTLKNNQSVNTYNISAHGGVGVIGISAGVGFNKQMDKLAGINETYNNLLKESSSFLPSLLGNVQLANAIASTKKIVRTENYLQNPNNTTAIETNITQATSLIKVFLAKKYPGQLDEEYNNAANNIFNGLVNTDFDGSQVGLQKISSYFAEQRNENAINNLKGKTKLTGWGVGFHLFVSPTALMGVVPFSLRFTKFNNGYKHVDTVGSLLGIKNAERYGANNKEITMTSTQRVSYLNDMIAAAHMIPRDGSIKPSPAITTDGQFITIPRELYMNNKLNIKLDPSMKGRVAESNGDLILPGDVPMRMSAHPQSQGAEYILDVGNVRTAPDALHLIRGRESLIASSGYFVDKSKITVKSHEEIAGIKTDGPDGLTEKLKTISKKDILSTTVQGDNVVITLVDGTSQTIPLQGGIFEGITFSYQDKKLSLQFKTSTGTSTDTVPNTNTLVYTHQLSDQMMTDVHQQSSTILEKFETQNKFNDFLQNVMERDTDGAIAALLSLGIPSLQDTIKNAAPEQKQQLVAYMLSEFALENKTYKGKSAIDIMKERDDTAKKGSIPAFERIENKDRTYKIRDFLTRDMFESAYNAQDKVGNLPSKPQDNLIGYTAFYGRTKSNKERGYAMTLPGHTNVLSDKVIPFADSTKETAAKNWLFETMKSDSFAKDAILQALKTNKLPSNLIDKVSGKNLFDILDGGLVNLGGGCSIQITAKPVYYLLAECGNESIGLQISSIKVCGQPGSDSVEVGNNIQHVYNWNKFTINNTGSTGTAALGAGTTRGFGAAVGGKIAGKSDGGEIMPDDYTDPDHMPDDYTSNDNHK